jgi:Nickel-dependent hydrogenase
MSQRIVVDPISRIEGQLRIEAVLDSSNTITKAYSAGTMFRGIEIILQGRDPRDAGLLAMRICGVCTGVHYWTSARAVENAFGVHLTKNARLVRNLIEGSLFVHDHPVHFYQLHALDFVDIVSALSANPKRAVDVAYTYTNQPYNASEDTYSAVQAKLQSLVKSGSLGIFGNGYWGNPSYLLTPEENLVAVSHYLDTLQVQRTAAKLMAILGGKNPHPQSIVVGGVTCVEDIQNPERLAQFGQYLEEVTQFIKGAYLPDLLMAGKAYAKEGLAGIGAGLKTYLCYGGFPLTDTPGGATLFSGGMVVNGDLSTVYPFDQANVREDVTHSWYQGDAVLHPYQGETVPGLHGPRPAQRDRVPEDRREIQLAEVPHPRRPSRRDGAAGEGDRQLRCRQRHGPPGRGRGAEGGRLPGVGAVLDDRTNRGAVRRDADHRRRDGGLAGRAAAQHRCRRPGHVDQLRLRLGLQGRRGLRPGRGTARLARPLGADQGRPDRQLPGDRTDHMERLTSRRPGSCGRVRGGTGRRQARQARRAARDPAHDPQLRPVPGLLGPPGGRAGA